MGASLHGCSALLNVRVGSIATKLVRMRLWRMSGVPRKRSSVTAALHVWMGQYATLRTDRPSGAARKQIKSPGDDIGAIRQGPAIRRQKHTAKLEFRFLPAAAILAYGGAVFCIDGRSDIERIQEASCGRPLARSPRPRLRDISTAAARIKCATPTILAHEAARSLRSRFT